MQECIQCGNVQLTSGSCSVCGGALIPALSKAAAREEYITKLQHIGIELSSTHMDQLVDAIHTTS